MSIENLKNNYAIERGYESWANLRSCFIMSPFEMGTHEDKCIEYCIKRYMEAITQS